jgi:crotonobetainyl-CoA:carnitine CoA-transferase CaiB-like acyl-CoA transferase
MAEDLIDEKWREEEYRLSNMAHVIQVMERWTRMHSARELFELGQGMRFPWAPVISPEEVLQGPQLRAREFFVDVRDTKLGPEITTYDIP